MKNNFAFILFLFVINLCKTQTNEFAPVGAKWWYDDYLNDCPTFPDCGYYTIESVKDTLVEGINCRLLKEEHFESYYDIPDTNYIIYENEGIVYLYRDSDFFTLYDFTSIGGDTINVMEETFNGYYIFNDLTYTEFEYKIDSVGLITIDGIELKVQYTMPTGSSTGWGFWCGEIIERIGSTHLFLGLPNIIYPEFGSFLRCYLDDEIYYKNYAKDCDFVTGVNDLNPITHEFLLFPNPASNELFVQISTEYLKADYTLSIFDIAGKLLMETSMNINTMNSVNLKTLPKGIFFVRINKDEEMIHVEKIIKG